MEISLGAIRFDIITKKTNDYSFLENFALLNFQKYTHTISFTEDNDKVFIPKYEKIGVLGQPLPNNGTCIHYKLSYRWFRFPCCGKAFPCDECHDSASNHESVYAKNIICGFCSLEQPAANSSCKCGKSMNKKVNTVFWEGGSGCRDWSKMNNKDSHKFKNMNRELKKKLKK